MSPISNLSIGGHSDWGALVEVNQHGVLAKFLFQFCQVGSLAIDHPHKK
jgi:hypothetical protein